MSKIAFIAPYKEIFLAGQKVIKDLGLSNITESYIGRNNHAIPLAKRLEAAGVDVIVSRGGTAALIVKAGVEVPVVEISMGPELVRALVNAKQITGLDRPRIAVIAFRNMIYNLEVLSEILGAGVEIHELHSMETIEALVEQMARQKSVDIVMSGIQGVRLARQKGLKALRLNSSEAELRAAFLEAEKVAYARNIEKKRHQTFRVLVDYLMEGIISINGEGLIEVFNPAAQRLLGIAAEEVIGKKITGEFPMFDVADCLAKGQSLVGQIVKINKVTTLANIAPIKVASDLVGAMITFQDITKIAEMEVKIRKELYTKGLVAEYSFSDILGTSLEISDAKNTAAEFAASDATILMVGASGTGKELFAQSIHNASRRREGPFVAINCAAIPASLLESELFGYVEGAFTGANRKGKPGLFELAHHGTIFLDEISEMDKYGQSRLLRVVQEKQVMRLGDDRYIPVDVRIIAATNRNLAQLVKAEQFRKDLYYRLNVLSVHLPQLQARREDILILAGHFIREFSREYRGGRSGRLVFETKAQELLTQYNWPGNVRELKNFIERLVIRARGETITGDMVRGLLSQEEFADRTDSKTGLKGFAEKDRIVQAMIQTDFNQGKTAELLGIDRSTLYRKLKKHGIDIKKYCNN
ncbi:MAG: sigma 54-interacting transcriptional regulator [Negativicutes bacterium]|nr:sigma 54-interacting transcriptional regulator [Negativicutes bacterium]